MCIPIRTFSVIGSSAPGVCGFGIPDIDLARLQGALRGDARGERIRSNSKDRMHTIACALDDASAVGLDRFAQHASWRASAILHRVRILLPQRCAALDVREQEGDGARGQL